ncbi:MAG: 2-amino-4-hydroxy-6-hydroxymethyldihydropteridine diphosphokinase [Anaerolineae bacterium]|nr:2-amino-4-hydroxy-6-hydroxymethyldihydropteridine diphosphokinase [Phycisphaerae bacterium]
MPNATHIAYIGVGANVGDREGNIRAAIDRLRESPDVEVRQVSKLIDNPAAGGPAGSPSFLNGAVDVSPPVSARDLLDRLLEIEKSLGRERRLKWGPRTIDLDLLLFGDQIIAEPGITVPHALLHERTFVLEPMHEIAPNVIHPTLRKSMAELLAQMSKRESSE